MIDIVQELLSLDDIVELQMARVITRIRKPEHRAVVVCGVHIDRNWYALLELADSILRPWSGPMAWR